MVVLMDFPAKGEDEVGCICNDPGSSEEEATSIDRSLLESIPSSIPSSCIYRYQDFTCTRLADGFYGNIYKVQHRETKEVMVLKMNKPDVERDTCTMLDEIKLMSRLSHENVIRFLGICIDDSRVHLLCEFVNGGDLESLLLKHSVQLDWKTRLYLARDIAEGMRYLHKNGVIHRDLTSKNCLIKERNRWRYAIVADLGLATEIKEQSIVGSPYNMAPELLRGENYDEKADVFSYGIILCEIIGRVPADPDELPRTHSFGLDVEKFQHMTGDCPHEFLQTALCCCQMEPSSRPTFVETAKHLEYILVGTRPFRPVIDEAMDALPPKTQSPRQNICQSEEENKHGMGPKKDFVEGAKDIKAMSTLSPPAIIVSTDTSPVMNRSAEKRRQSWIAGRYKLFNTATDDLLSNTPSKLKSFFHRVLRVQTHFDPSKHKKVRESSKQRSASQLKSYSIIASQDEGDAVTFVDNHEQAGSGSPNPTSSNSHGFLRRKSSERDLPDDQGTQEDCVDGSPSPQSPHLDGTHSTTSPPTPERVTSPKLLDVTQSPHSPQNPSELNTPVSKESDNFNRPRCNSTPLFNDLNPGPLSRRTASHRECEMNNAVHSPPDVHGKTGKVKNKKSFRFFKRKGSKCKDGD